MIGVYVGGSTGGLITSLPARHPGHAVGDRHHLRRLSRWRSNGEPGRAHLARRLGFDPGRAARRAVCWSLLTGPLAAIALEFGPWEYFSLFVLALAMVAGLTEASLVKGCSPARSACVITGARHRPDRPACRASPSARSSSAAASPFLPVLIGIFAFAQIMTDIEKMGSGDERQTNGRRAQRSSVLAPARSTGRSSASPFLLLWATIVGLVIGMLPAIGGSASSVMAYDQAKKFSKHAGEVRQRHPGGHHRLGGLQQRQRRRLAGDHHGVRHSRATRSPR